MAMNANTAGPRILQRCRNRWMTITAIMSLACVVAWAAPIAAQDPEKKPDETEKKASDSDDLAYSQGQLADKYKRLEELLLKRSDFEASVNPRRAALLKQAFKQSKDRLTQAQLKAVVRLLNQENLTDAISGQEQVQKDLQALLALLQSENRADRLKSEQQRIKEYIKELKRLERLQRAERGRNEGGAEFKDLSKNQGKIADRAGNLGDRIEQDEARNAAAGGEGPESAGRGCAGTTARPRRCAERVV